MQTEGGGFVPSRCTCILVTLLFFSGCLADDAQNSNEEKNTINDQLIDDGNDDSMKEQETNESDVVIPANETWQDDDDPVIEDTTQNNETLETNQTNQTNQTDAHCLSVENLTVNSTLYVTLSLVNICDKEIHYPGVNATVDNPYVSGLSGLTEWYYLIFPNTSYNHSWQLSLNESIPNGTEITLTFAAMVLNCETSDFPSHDCPDSVAHHTFTVMWPENTTDSGNETGVAQSTGCRTGDGLAPPPSGVSEFTLSQVIDGESVTRRVIVHVPEDLDSSRCYPLLFALHGNGGEPDGFVNSMREFIADSQFIGIYPEGHKSSWNLGREASNANDTEFLEGVAQALVENYTSMDHNRRYVIGFSNGAGMAHKLGIESNDFRAFVAIVTSLTTANLPDSSSGHPAVMQILGENDGLIPYEGGEGVAGHVFLPGDESARIWAEHNGCDLTPEVTNISDGSVKTMYTNCTNNSDVINYKVAGAGHGIPHSFEGGLLDLCWLFLSTH